MDNARHEITGTSVKLPKKMAKKLAQLQQDNGMTKSEMIVSALAERLNMPEFVTWKEEEDG